MPDIIDRYEDMKKRLDAFFVAPSGRIILISGENATGKTYQLDRSAERNGFIKMDHREALSRTGGNNVMVHVGGGKYGPTFLYDMLHTNNDRVIHFEENIFLNAKNRVFLISGVENNNVFQYPGESPPDYLPGSFTFTGGIIITTYQPPESIYQEILDRAEVIDIGLKGDPENMLFLIEHELEGIVRSYNEKMPWKPISTEEAEDAVALYRQEFERIRSERKVTPPYMVNFLWIFEMLRSLTSPDASEQDKIDAIEQSFDEVPGNVTLVRAQEE